MQTSRPPVPSAQPADATPVPPVFSLPPRWSTEAQQALQAFLVSNRDRDVQISLAALRRADWMMAQYLIAAARAWAARGLDLALVDRPPSFDEAMELAGITPALLRGTA